MPGYSSVVLALTSLANTGKVIVSLPDGFTGFGLMQECVMVGDVEVQVVQTPYNRSAMTLPYSSPGYPTSRIAGTELTQGSVTGSPFTRTTTVFG